MDKFKLKTKLKPKGDQPQAIKKLTQGFKKSLKDQVLLGVTGSGKTFTMANIIAKVQKPTLVISHNKTLAAQLASEFRDFFPENAVQYYVSYYDYYQPEAYMPTSDTYIEKETSVNEEIERLRHAATHSLLTRSDVLIVASVSCIYGLGTPEDYQAISISLKKGETLDREELFNHLISSQYQRNDTDFYRGRFRVRGEVVDIFPAYENAAFRLKFFEDQIENILQIDPLTGEILGELQKIVIYPASHWVTPKEKLVSAIKDIKKELKERVSWFKKEGKDLEAQRITQRTNYDIEMMQEVGYCSGIENYSRHLEGRKKGLPPHTLIDYYPDDFLLFVDESHMTVPQIGGMYEGDRSRKETLIKHGFRLPSAFDNRPLKFNEFTKKINRIIYVSATPAKYELEKSSQNKVKSFQDFTKKTEGITQQVVRPTGLLDPEIEVRKTKGQIDDLIEEIRKRTEKSQRVLVTTLTKRMAEDLADYLKEFNIKVQYLHSEVATLERLDILRDLREGKYNVLVGINLLREGLDLPEVSLVAILDADKESFLRNDVSLIQVSGRTSRHQEGKVIMYADNISGSMERAISEMNRRRQIQIKYNKKHKITPKSIKKAIRDDFVPRRKIEEKAPDISGMPKDEIFHLVSDLKNQMDLAAKNLEFEKAAQLRDQISEIQEFLSAKRISKRK